MKKKFEFSDLTEEERFMKALSKCRNCEHIRMTHTFLIDSNGRCIDVRVSKTGVFKECDCNLFSPKDNLEYLQWKYENKKDKKRKK